LACLITLFAGNKGNSAKKPKLAFTKGVSRTFPLRIRQGNFQSDSEWLLQKFDRGLGFWYTAWAAWDGVAFV
jgi:hypothetical protein